MGQLHAVKSPPPVSIVSEIVYVTPSMASQWLASNRDDQRPISRATVAKFAEDMRNDLWRTTHQSMALDKDGRLIDGQHRLSALVSAGVSLWLKVDRYAGDAPMSAFDIGRKRTSGDALVVSGVVSASHGRAAAACSSAIRRGADVTQHPPSSAVVAVVYETHKAGIDHVIGQLPKAIAPVQAALAYLYPAAPAEVDAIIGKLRTNVGLEMNTGEQLLSLLLREKAPHNPMEYGGVFYKTLSACEHTIKKKAIVRLQRPNDDTIRRKEFPMSLLWANKMRVARGLTLGSGA